MSAPSILGIDVGAEGALALITSSGDLLEIADARAEPLSGALTPGCGDFNDSIDF
jgi:hypothetical protein